MPSNCAGVGNTAAKIRNEVLITLAFYVVDFMYFCHVILPISFLSEVGLTHAVMLSKIWRGNV